MRSREWGRGLVFRGPVVSVPSEGTERKLAHCGRPGVSHSPGLVALPTATLLDMPLTERAAEQIGLEAA